MGLVGLQQQQFFLLFLFFLDEMPVGYRDTATPFQQTHTVSCLRLLCSHPDQSIACITQPVMNITL